MIKLLTQLLHLVVVGDDGQVAEHTTSDGEYYRFQYDFAGGQTVVSGKPEQKWQWWFDEQTYVTAHRTPGGGMYRFTCNDNHFPVAVELPGERTVTLEYDTLSRVVKEADPEGRITRYGYDEQGLLATRTDARGGEVALVHDARGQLTMYTDCSGRSTGYEYDEDGNLTAVTDAEGKTVRIRYNRLGLPETVSHPGKQQDRYTWNALGRRIRKVTYDRHTTGREQSRSTFVWEGSGCCRRRRGRESGRSCTTRSSLTRR
ncbi:RHS repeat protein [Citrobacter sp. ku-bf4]|nr:RHS repeat protein [Citrobacter sp. ku-bf4]MBS0827980.1 RHS repeat protein [Citrobacter amalonaticus]